MTLLTEAELGELSPAERVAYNDERSDDHAELPALRTPMLDRTVTKGLIFMRLNRGQQTGTPCGMILSGVPGVGKTTAVKALGRTVEQTYWKRLTDHGCRLITARVTTQARILFRQRDVDIVVVTFERVDVGGVSYITTNRAICLAAGSTVAVICFNSCHGNLRCAASPARFFLGVHERDRPVARAAPPTM
jgi:DNA polymerase III delta prime subunit